MNMTRPMRHGLTVLILALTTSAGLAAPAAHGDDDPPPPPPAPLAPPGPLWYSQITPQLQTFVNNYVSHGYGEVRVPNDALPIAALGNRICLLIQNNGMTPAEVSERSSWGRPRNNPITKLAITDICPQYLPLVDW